MRLPRLANWLFNLMFRHVVLRREPNFIVGAADPSGAYLRRWHLIPRNRVCNVYLHCFLRDDDDRALHDHPWAWLSFLISGAYIEHTIDAGGIHQRHMRRVGSLKLSSARRAHRIELPPRFSSLDVQPECWTIFITGPVTRAWGFHCPQRGWVPWQRFTVDGKPGEIGPGCDA